MYSDVNYLVKDNKLIIDIIPRHSLTTKIDFATSALIYILSPFLLWQTIKKSDAGILIILIFMIAYVFIKAGNKSLNRVFSKEKLILSDDILSLQTNHLFSSEIKNYDKNKIKHLELSRRVKDTHIHVPYNQSLSDINAEDNQYIYRDGVISFFYEGQIIIFGVDLDNDDAIKMILKIQDFLNI